MQDPTRADADDSRPLSLPGFGRPLVEPFSTVGARVADLIRRDIQRGILKPGERLRQREVAERFQVSTTPIREAFQTLQAEGFLRIHSHRGATVVQPSPDEIREVYKIRKALEGLAVAEAAASFVPEFEPVLRELLDQMEKAREGEEWVEIDQRFHLTIYQMSGMPRLIPMVTQLRVASFSYMETASENRARREQASIDHRRILEACLKGDRDAARIATEDHLEHTAQTVAPSE